MVIRHVDKGYFVNDNKWLKKRIKLEREQNVGSLTFLSLNNLSDKESSKYHGHTLV